jgi:hypothetical protein
MKKIIFLFLVAGTFVFQSCKSTKAITQSSSSTDETVVLGDPLKARIDRFVTVEAVSDLRAGMTLSEVTAKLGSSPHNLLSAQADGHHIVQYKYRLSQMEVLAEQVNNVGVEKNNKLYYKPGNHDLFIVFNPAGKLEYLVTEEFAMSEKLLRENNLLYVIKKDKDKFVANPDSNYRKTNAAVFSPMVVCPDCDAPKGNSNSSSQPIFIEEAVAEELTPEEASPLPFVNAPAKKKRIGKLIKRKSE